MSALASSRYEANRFRLYIYLLSASNPICPQKAIDMFKSLLCRVMRVDAMPTVRHKVCLRSHTCCRIQKWDCCSSDFDITHTQTERVVVLAEHNIDGSGEAWSRSEDAAVSELDAYCVGLFRGKLVVEDW